MGVLALTNFGIRHRLMVDGVPVGREITDLMPVENREGSCIVVLATDAPLTARQCERLAKRCALGLAATGSYASDGSGEIMVAFTTAHRVPRDAAEPLAITSVTNDQMCELFEAAVDATAESVCNALHGGDHHRRARRQHRLRTAAGPPRRRPAARRPRGAAARGVAPPCRARRAVYRDPLAARLRDSRAGPSGGTTRRDVRHPGTSSPPPTARFAVRPTERRARVV